MRRAIAIGAVLSVMSVLPAAAEGATVAQLERKVAKLESKVKRQQNLLTNARDEANALELERYELSKQVGGLNSQVGSLQADNAKLREGLPTAILTVPRADFLRLVLNPAIQAWPCRSVYQSTPYWSLSFDNVCL